MLLLNHLLWMKNKYSMIYTYSSRTYGIAHIPNIVIRISTGTNIDWIFICLICIKHIFIGKNAMVFYLPPAHSSVFISDSNIRATHRRFNVNWQSITPLTRRQWAYYTLVEMVYEQIKFFLSCCLSIWNVFLLATYSPQRRRKMGQIHELVDA